MIQTETILKVADNSGAILAQCIRVLKNKKTATLGDKIVVSIKKARPNKKVKKGEVYKAIVVRTKKESLRKDGTTIKFTENNIVLINSDDLPIGNRISGPVTYELRPKNYLKVISLAPTII